MTTRSRLAWAVSVVLTTACAPDVSSEVQARRAYLGLDRSIEKSMTAGFAGFNEATSANIPPQIVPGDEAGTLTISGQVDAGASANKQMRLRIGMVDYSDGRVEIPDHDAVSITYDTNADITVQPALTLNLQGIPAGTFDGTLVGDYSMSGDVTGSVRLELTLGGELEDAGGGTVRRKQGTTAVSGTATSAAGTYEVSLTL